MSPLDAQCLQEVYRREYRSLLQYIREASPYAAGPDRLLRDAVLRIAKEEAAALESFGAVLESLRVSLPYLGSFPVAFTDLNFVTIRHLIPKLIAEQKRDIAKLEAEAVGWGGTVESGGTVLPAGVSSPGGTVQRLIEVHTRHLKELEALG